MNETELPDGLGKSVLSMKPKSHVDPVFVDFDHAICSVSPGSASDAEAVRLTGVPADANTSGPIVNTGKLFSAGFVSS